MYRLINYRLINGESRTKKIKSSKQKDILLTNQSKLSKIISDKIDISPSEYSRKKNIVIKSVARNMRSMQLLNNKGKFLFVYLPTRFSFTLNQNNIESSLKISPL